MLHDSTANTLITIHDIGCYLMCAAKIILQKGFRALFFNSSMCYAMLLIVMCIIILTKKKVQFKKC